MRARSFELLGALGVAIAVALGCSRKPPPEERPLPRASASVTGPSRGAAALASVLTSVHSRISLAAPSFELQPLAFGSKLFARLVPDGVEVFSVPAFTGVMEQKLSGARGVLEIAGGSLVAVGVKQALRIDPGAKAPVRLPPVPWLPGTLLLPERRDSDMLWSVQTVGRFFVRQKLELDPTRSFDKGITLEGYAGGSVTVLRDGALLYAAPGGVRRALPEGRPRAFRTALEPWRLLPARRIDQAWGLAADGRVELWQLSDRLSVVTQFTLGAAPFAAAASPLHLAVVVVDEPGNAPRRFRLLVLDQEGTRVLERALPEGPPETGEDWAAAAVRDRYVALSETEPFVAVGGPGGAEVFRLPDGERVLVR